MSGKKPALWRWERYSDRAGAPPERGVRHVSTILREGFPEASGILARSLEGGDWGDPSASVVLGIVTRYLAEGVPLPAELAEWVIYHLWSRPPLTLNKPKHRARSMEHVDALTRFAQRWAAVRPRYAFDDEALQALSVEFHKSYGALKRWLHDPYVQDLVRKFSKGDPLIEPP